MINRREFLRYASLRYASLASNIAWSHNIETKPNSPISLSKELKSNLDLIIDTIIPKDDHPGALDLNVPDFVILMVQDCLEQDAQTDFICGLHDFDLFVSAKYTQPFAAIDPAKRLDAIKHISNAKTAPEQLKLNLSALKAFLNLTKRFTVQGYMQSEYIMTKVFPYILIPGPYHASVPITQARF